MTPTTSFNLEALQMALEIRRSTLNLTWAAVADEAQVSRSTISRIMQGKKPDADTLVRLVTWSGVSFNLLISRKG